MLREREPKMFDLGRALRARPKSNISLVPSLRLGTILETPAPEPPKTLSLDDSFREI